MNKFVDADEYVDFLQFDDDEMNRRIYKKFNTLIEILQDISHGPYLTSKVETLRRNVGAYIARYNSDCADVWQEKYNDLKCKYNDLRRKLIWMRNELHLEESESGTESDEESSAEEE